jgi:DNA-binding MarR family transcriptional regulator
MAINSLIYCIETMRARAPGLNLQEALAILQIAEHPGLTITDLAGLLGVATSSASRYARALIAPEEAFARPPSWGLVTISHTADKRSVALSLSPLGEALVAELNNALGAAAPINVTNGAVAITPPVASWPVTLGSSQR